MRKMNRKTIEAYAERISGERHRKFSPEEAEEEIVGIIRRVSAGLSHRFVYGYHTRQDMEQEGIAIGLEVLSEDPPKYDARRPLENFLYVHMHNQLHNLKRKLFMRSELPCTCCDPFNPPAEPCQRMKNWRKRNTSKQNIMRPIDLDSVSEAGGKEESMSEASTVEEDAVGDEVFGKIDRGLPPDLRADYLRMRGGVKVPKSRRQRVRDAVMDILLGEGNAT